MGSMQKSAEDTERRLFEYDFTRVMAMICVIAVHALVVIDFSDKISLLYFNIMQAIFFSCNGIFFYDKWKICSGIATNICILLL